MSFLYNIILHIVSLLLPLSTWFSKKMTLFVEGRRNVWFFLKSNIHPQSEYVWFHVASLGEYEQGLPVMEAYKEQFPQKKIILTFFSPSGYEVRKNNSIADITLYLPLDTKKNAKNFITLIKPTSVFFVKYEFWPNYLSELKKHSIPTYLISGIFRKEQVFFKWYGSFYRNVLHAFTHFFVQQQSSKNLLQKIGFDNTSISGDTRFDRVVDILENPTKLSKIENFINEKITIILGSSWPEDEAIWFNYINNSKNLKFIIAPHQIKPEYIQKTKNSITKNTILFTELEHTNNLETFDVLIINNIGQLTKIYAYADMAYVGGGFGAGIHNILEPAAYGIPIIIGPKYQKFQEANDLLQKRSCLVANNESELKNQVEELISNSRYRKSLGDKNREYVTHNSGATKAIINYLKSQNQL